MNIKDLVSPNLKARLGFQPTNPEIKPEDAIAPSAKPDADTTAAKNPTPQDRPYWTPGKAMILPPAKVFREIYMRGGNPVLIQPDEREALRKIQQQIDALSSEVRRLTSDGIRVAMKQARRRLQRGNGSLADANFNVGNELQARKELKRSRSRLITQACPLLEKIAIRVQNAAKKALPTVEADSTKLGVASKDSPLVCMVATATWFTSQSAANSIYSPKMLLRQLAIRL